MAILGLMYDLWRRRVHASFTEFSEDRNYKVSILRNKTIVTSVLISMWTRSAAICMSDYSEMIALLLSRINQSSCGTKFHTGDSFLHTPQICLKWVPGIYCESTTVQLYWNEVYFLCQTAVSSSEKSPLFCFDLSGRLGLHSSNIALTNLSIHLVCLCSTPR